MEEVVSTKTVGRIVQLDFLRGVAILLVLVQHLREPPVRTMPEQSGHFEPILRLVYTFGWSGVDMFFVLSGFLIGGLLFREIQTYGKLNLGRFMIRRGFKIWPLYYCYLFLATYSYSRTHFVGIRGSVMTLLPQFAHLQNYYPPDFGMEAPLFHTWSLAVEEHFYLAFPLLLLFLTRMTPNCKIRINGLPWWALGVMIICLGLRFWMARFPWESETHYSATHIRIDSLFFGVLIAYIWNYHPERLEPLLRRPLTLLMIGTLLVSPMFYFFVDTPFASTVGYSLLYLGYGAILLGVLATTTPGQSRTRLARFFKTPVAKLISHIGFYSYGIYLFHMYPAKWIMGWAMQSLPSRWTTTKHLVVGIGVDFLVAIFTGIVASRLIEIPSLALRDRLFPSATGRSVRLDIHTQTIVGSTTGQLEQIKTR